MRNFTQAPNAVVFNHHLSLGARVAHTALLHLAWKAGRRNGDDAVALPPIDELADMVGCSRTAFYGYVKELRSERLLMTKRVRHQGMVYVVFEHPVDDAKLVRIPAQPAEGAMTESGLLRAGAILVRPNTEAEANASTSPGSIPRTPPRPVMVDGQNLAFNALRDECGIDARGNRAGVVAVALNGRGAAKGIRELFWLEMSDWAVEHNRLDVVQASVDNPFTFEQALARAISRKAALYRTNMNGATLTPTALRNWWFDVEKQRREKAGMSPDEMRNFNG